MRLAAPPLPHEFFSKAAGSFRNLPPVTSCTIVAGLVLKILGHSATVRRWKSRAQYSRSVS
jgi:hypothetical protein